MIENSLRVYTVPKTPSANFATELLPEKMEFLS